MNRVGGGVKVVMRARVRIEARVRAGPTSLRPLPSQVPKGPLYGDNGFLSQVPLLQESHKEPPLWPLKGLGQSVPEACSLGGGLVPHPLPAWLGPRPPQGLANLLGT